jgi:putative ABC transport system permease protein
LYYPSMGGSRIMLIDGPEKQMDTMVNTLETCFRDYGMMAIPASERLASFNVVENTYLSVFMMLGGLGIVFGTIGLGILLLRNILQRQQEFAVYIAIGFNRRFVLNCILAEHLLILMGGILIGVLSALSGILPSLISPAYKAPVVFIAGIILVILVNGFVWIWFPAMVVMKKNLLAGLRNE